MSTACPPCPRARKRATRVESLYLEHSALYSGVQVRWKRLKLPQAGFRAQQLLLSRISISPAAQSMGSMGSLITAVTNPCNHAASRPKWAQALGMQQALAQAGSGLPNYCHHESRQPCRIPPQGERALISPSY